MTAIEAGARAAPPPARTAVKCTPPNPSAARSHPRLGLRAQSAGLCRLGTAQPAGPQADKPQGSGSRTAAGSVWERTLSAVSWDAACLGRRLDALRGAATPLGAGVGDTLSSASPCGWGEGQGELASHAKRPSPDRPLPWSSTAAESTRACRLVLRWRRAAAGGRETVARGQSLVDDCLGNPFTPAKGSAGSPGPLGGLGRVSPATACPRGRFRSHISPPPQRRAGDQRPTGSGGAMAGWFWSAAGSPGLAGTGFTLYRSTQPGGLGRAVAPRRAQDPAPGGPVPGRCSARGWCSIKGRA